MELNRDMINIWSEECFEVLENFAQDSKVSIDTLIKSQKFDKNFFSRYIYVQKKRCLVDEFLSFTFNKSDKIKKGYDYLISHGDVSENAKAALDLRLLENLLNSPLFNFSCSFNKEMYSLSSVLSDICLIIENGYIFKNKIATFRSLMMIFSSNIITENLPAKNLNVCLESFSILNVMAKKLILKNLVKKKQEIIILNLFNKGVDLNWMIDFEGNGQAEVCSLKILENLKLSDVLLSNVEWNMLAKNSTGDNILHIMCGSSLFEGNSKKLNTRISFLSVDDKCNFLSEKNNKGLTPLSQAILLKDEDMVNFLIQNGVKKWSKCESNPLKFLEGCINGKNDCFLPESLQGNFLDKEFWHNLLKQWESEKLYLELEDSLCSKKIKEKSVKI